MATTTIGVCCPVAASDASSRRGRIVQPGNGCAHRLLARLLTHPLEFRVLLPPR